MKANLIVVVGLLFATFSVVAQEDDLSSKFELVSADIVTGKGYLSGGYALSFAFRSEKALTLITLREDKVFINHLYPLMNKKFSLGPSTGHFCNVPFAGAIAKFSPWKAIETLHWTVYSFGLPNEAVNINPSFLFLINTATLKVCDFKAYYASVVFMKNAMKHVVGLSYELKMTNHFAAYTNVGYDLTNKEQLLQVGVVWRK